MKPYIFFFMYTVVLFPFSDIIFLLRSHAIFLEMECLNIKEVMSQIKKF